ncbi:hypothetical protein EK904_013949 [Melospiza melodia maxima]|nr:hypothetical protein EK904_013949 [Melospiza melodia maxima]
MEVLFFFPLEKPYKFNSPGAALGLGLALQGSELGSELGSEPCVFVSVFPLAPSLALSRRRSSSDNVFVGESATFTCELSPPGVGSVQWWLDGTPLHNNLVTEISQQDGRIHTLTLNDVACHDSGTVTFRAGSLISTAKLLVKGIAPRARNMWPPLDLLHVLVLLPSRLPLLNPSRALQPSHSAAFFSKIPQNLAGVVIPKFPTVLLHSWATGAELSMFPGQDFGLFPEANGCGSQKLQITLSSRLDKASSFPLSPFIAVGKICCFSGKSVKTFMACSSSRNKLTFFHVPHSPGLRHVVRSQLSMLGLHNITALQLHSFHDLEWWFTGDGGRMEKGEGAGAVS